ncbi:MAG TPA: class I SAM-dependent methyltransferase [Metabacillus sp.]|nr:class I SAM-dependent methyltransferase [Metabacillus sp.]
MGREFLDIFESWAASYDHTVSSEDNEYREVFKHYELILEKVAHLSKGHVLEFGAGTGNLTKKLLREGHTVTAIEPSKEMRRIFKEKIPGHLNYDILDGDFLRFEVSQPVDTIVSTYAFHHLTDQEKSKAISIYQKLLKKGGKVVFADTMYQSEIAQLEGIEEAKNANLLSLAKDLETEYYSTIPFLEKEFTKNSFDVTFTQCNSFVWILDAMKR